MLSTNLESILGYLCSLMEMGGGVRFLSFIVGTYDSFSRVLKNVKLWVVTKQFTPNINPDSKHNWSHNQI